MPGNGNLKRPLSRQAIEVWWEYIILVPVMIFGVYCFVWLAGFRMRSLTSKSDRTAESMYGNYSDSSRKQRKYARQHGGQWHDGEGGNTL
jgi:hypothetical protein